MYNNLKVNQVVKILCKKTNIDYNIFENTFYEATRQGSPEFFMVNSTNMGTYFLLHKKSGYENFLIITDYFYTKEELRDLKINNIISF